MLPGQGSQFAEMGVPLYESDTRFRRALDDFFDAYGPGAERLRHEWLHHEADDLGRGSFAQPLLFGINYAAGVVWLKKLGGADVTLIGHSVGELAAATLAGAFDLELAGALLKKRAELLDAAPRGGMIACRSTENELREHLGELEGRAFIAAENADNQCVVSCAEEDLPETMRHLGARRVTCLRVGSTEPFHSPLLGPAAAEFERFLAGRGHLLSPVRLPVISAYSARRVSDQEVVPAWFWTRQMAEKVNFWEALRRNCDAAPHTFVEIGPGNILSMATRRLPSVRTRRSTVVTAMPRHQRDTSHWKSAMHEVAEVLEG
ncbi:acyltransferase domain-containing protein [Streptomyces tendae]|uniref:acyltransferase domain-containing protein n=1 Tax=Streptomyces tendae TaxID=1932 RepID=UPI00369809B0